MSEPRAPPSELAPLSEQSTMRVSSRSPVSREVVEDAADLRVGEREVRSEALHEPRGHRLILGAERVPRGHPVRPRRELGTRRQQPHLELACERGVAPRVPAAVEVAAVARDPFGGRVVRRVARTGGEVAEEGLFLVDRAQVGEELDRTVGEVGAQVVAVLVASRREHRVVVVVERGRELVRLAAVESVPPVEAAAERPAGPRRGHARLVVGGEVPLAHGVARVAVRAQDLGQEAVLARDHAPVAGIAHGEVGDAAHAVAVMVAPGQQARPGGGAESGRVEVREPNAVGREPVDRRRVDVGAVASELRVAHVVEHDQQHVGRARRAARAPAATRASSPASRDRSLLRSVAPCVQSAAGWITSCPLVAGW